MPQVMRLIVIFVLVQSEIQKFIIHNDGFDFSGSKLTITNSLVKGAGDKGYGRSFNVKQL